MNSYAIDTHTAIKKLEAVGFQTEQAEVVTALFSSREAEPGDQRGPQNRSLRAPRRTQGR